MAAGDAKALGSHGGEQGQASDKVSALVDLLRNRSYAEIRQRMYDSAPGSPWWAACRAELDLRNGQQFGPEPLVEAQRRGGHAAPPRDLAAGQ